MRCALVALAVAGLLAGCVAPKPALDPGRGTVEIRDFGRYDRFPAELAGFRRGRVLEYAPPLRDYSVAYDRHDAMLSNAVTLYFYPPTADTPESFDREVAEIVRAHPGATITARLSSEIEQGGATYALRRADFEYVQRFDGREQTLWSQVLIVHLPHGTFKARSTAPVDQGAFAAGKLRQLLDAIRWSAP